MEPIFDIAAKVSTPLALGGFFAAVVFFIFKQVLKQDFLRRLTTAHSAEVIKLVIDKLFVLALVAMVLGFLAYVLIRVLPQVSAVEPTATVAAPVPTPAPTATPRIKIGSAIFGTGDQSKRCDATAYVRDLCDGAISCPVFPSNAMCGDPKKGTPKHLFVTYRCGDVARPRLDLLEGHEATIECP